MRILVTRPEPDAAAQAELLRARGHEPVLSPLLELDFLNPPLELYRAQALIATSRNAIRALSVLPQREQAKELPLLAVGRTTAEAATALGFRQLIEGPGTGRGLADLIAARLDPSKGALLHLAGEHLSFDLGAALERFGFRVDIVTLYRAEPAAGFSEEAERALSEGSLDGVIFMSQRTARTFAELSRNKAYPLASLSAFCLSDQVALPLAGLPMRLRIARQPDQEELLALIAANAPSS